MDALSSAVAMKVNSDLQLTLMASSLYRLLGTPLGNGYEVARADHIFRDFVNAELAHASRPQFPEPTSHSAPMLHPKPTFQRVPETPRDQTNNSGSHTRDR